MSQVAAKMSKEGKGGSPTVVGQPPEKGQGKDGHNDNKGKGKDNGKKGKK